uniref:Beta-glucosidase 2 n=1 Tax=Sphaerotermes sphaerothorax TaxID=187564 RepID=X2CGG4_9NEOP|nr:beta-glucosidase 2 [Sphaerotermes sphaerothorax]
MKFQTVCQVILVRTGFAGFHANLTFPDGFLLGAATASYQIEGGWDAYGKGLNIWDTLTHEPWHLVEDTDTGDVADDSYHLYHEDVKWLKGMGAQWYRFSISWARILPEGHDWCINEPGIDYYNRLINGLLDNGIEPMVSMYHWDLPQRLQDLGGWPNSILANYLENYARVLFKNFGDRVKLWQTFNEPHIFMAGYDSDKGMAPSIDTPGIGDYLASHTVLVAHANIYRLYEREFKQQQQGKVGIHLGHAWCEPFCTGQQERCERYQQFHLGGLAHPIFRDSGDYPSVVKERVDHNSKREGYTASRLPRFTGEEVKLSTGTLDFLGINFYTACLGFNGVGGLVPSKGRDMGKIRDQDPLWPASASSWLRVVPWGYRKELNWIAKEYVNPPVCVTENGYSDYGGLNDTQRVVYYTEYMKEMLKAIHEDGVNVFGYTAWSLLDNFEWLRGYTEKFGLHEVDFNDPSRPRIPKESAKVLTEIFNTRKIPDRFLD